MGGSGGHSPLLLLLFNERAQAGAQLRKSSQSWMRDGWARATCDVGFAAGERLPEWGGSVAGSRKVEMEFGWSEEQSRYRAEVREVLEEFLPEDWDKISAQGVASPAQIEFSKQFAPRLAERGLLTSHWPKEYGGKESAPWNHFILAEEMNERGEPRGPQYMNVNWIGPTLMRYGTEEQKAQHLPPIAEGKAIWCQCYSEPGAGTDLAALQTKAERRGDKYIVNGQKIWTSYSNYADWTFLLVRTGSGRKDISILLVPMNTPGIEVRRFPGLVPKGHLNEVFFTDVEVPVSNRLGDESMAWEIILYALNLERVGIPRYHTGRMLLSAAVEHLRNEGRFNANARERAGIIVAKFEAARLLTYFVVDQRAKQQPPTADGNIARLTASEASTDLMEFIADFVPQALVDSDPKLASFYCNNIPSTIAAGTYEIQLNLIAQQALGLPKGA